MNTIRIEEWNGHQIRFIEKLPGDWWAVAKDVASALGYNHTPSMVRMLDQDEKGVHILHTPGGNQKMTIISETGIYEAIWNSRKPEAKDFKKWVKQTIKALRQASGLEGFQVFRMLDKDHQKEMMRKLRESLNQPGRVDYIKANTIANKAVSAKYGYPKMVKKNEMTPDMLIDRQQILEDTVNLMVVKEKFGLDISVSKTVYDKYIS
ncbi:BRO-N domain-containing protein [Parageobacillus thermoglucosidasius]|uniref:BRO-N domain-containing protein n=1 Tax=Parageobacillus thermoglucosidasius TaxID=1426 RepID=UPI0001D1735C|nr:BRO family protein [Parageobacillus thermoglucosidasius]AEH46743.1 prophage antirepressor [Parageobacillus thermoglucosidasius C56-YS93]